MSDVCLFWILSNKLDLNQETRLICSEKSFQLDAACTKSWLEGNVKCLGLREVQNMDTRGLLL